LSMARRSQLEGRLLAVLDTDRRRSAVGLYRSFVWALLGISIVVGLGMTRPEFRAAEQVGGTTKTTAAKDGTRLVVTGVVLSPDQEPVPDAHVEVLAHNNRGGWNHLLADDLKVDRMETQTDKSGRFRFELPRDISRPRSISIVASTAQDFPAIQNVDARLAHADVKLQLVRSKKVRVQLVDPVGNPLPDVTPHLRYVMVDNGFIGAPHPDGDAVTKAWPAFSASDENGYCEATLPVTTTRASLTVNDPRAGAHRLDIEISDKPVSAVLDAPSFLNGKVVDADGKPIAGAEVTFMEQPTRMVRTADDGTFRVARGSTIDTLFAPGQAIIHIYPPEGSDFLFQALEWQWPNDGIGDADLTIVMERGIIIEGQVVERGSGKPVVGAQLAFEPQVENNPHFKETYRSRFSGADMRYSTDDDGKFRMPVCPGPGHLLVTARSLDYVPVETSMGDMWYGKPGLQREYFQGVKQLNAESTREPITIELQRGETLRRQVSRPDGKLAQGLAFAASYLQDKKDVSGWLPSIPIADGLLELPGFDRERSMPLIILDPEGKCGGIVSAENISPDKPTIQLLPCGGAKFHFLNDKGEPLADYRPPIQLIFKTGAPATHMIEPDQPLWSDTIIWENVAGRSEPPKTDAEGRVIVDGLVPGAVYSLYYVSKDGVWDQGYEFKVKSGETTDVGDVVIPQRD